jgi:hypothetical protein
MWAKHTGPLCELRNTYKIMVLKSIGKKHLEGLKHGFVDNIKMNLKQVGYENVNR